MRRYLDSLFRFYEYGVNSRVLWVDSKWSVRQAGRGGIQRQHDKLPDHAASHAPHKSR